MELSSYELLKNNPKFKAYCRRRVNGGCKSMAEILADNRKRQRAEFAAFCRRRGVLSVLGEYTTGRIVVIKDVHCKYDYATGEKTGETEAYEYTMTERLHLQRIKGEVVSESPNPLAADTVSQLDLDFWTWNNGQKPKRKRAA